MNVKRDAINAVFSKSLIICDSISESTKSILQHFTTDWNRICNPSISTQFSDVNFLSALISSQWFKHEEQDVTSSLNCCQEKLF
jgi:hypothetical protein